MRISNPVIWVRAFDQSARNQMSEERVAETRNAVPMLAALRHQAYLNTLRKEESYLALISGCLDRIASLHARKALIVLMDHVLEVCHSLDPASQLFGQSCGDMLGAPRDELDQKDRRLMV